MRYTEALHVEMLEAAHSGQDTVLTPQKMVTLVNRIEELSTLVNRGVLEAEAQFDIGVAAGREATLRKLREQGYITAAQENRLKNPPSVPASQRTFSGSFERRRSNVF